MPDAPALLCLQIVKRFGATTALNSASLRVESGTIHALVGENGAGKSTLIGVISGLLRPDRGAVEVFGQSARFRSPRDAVGAGIGVVHQHFLLADALTVAENVALGLRTSALGWRFDRRKAEADVVELARQTGLAIDPAARVADLPVGLRQRVEIIKALSRGARILLLDEPTAVLAPPEVSTLFETLRRLRAAGRTIVVVTHKLDEVFALASDVTVLRRGETTFAGPLSGLNPTLLAEKMIGRVLENGKQKAEGGRQKAEQQTPPVLSLQSMNVPGALHVERLDVDAGEIVGIAGVEGNGQEELAALIAGTHDDRADAGAELQLRGKALLRQSVRERSESGLAYIPSDRHQEGLVLDFSLQENLHLRTPLTRGIAGVRLLDYAAMRTRSGELLRAYGAVPPDPELPARSLSGGNQQKVVIGRELSRDPVLILACNPTRGLDVGAAADVHQRLRAAAREKQAGVLLISSDLDEVLQLSDRVCVLYRGKLSEIGTRGVSRETVGRAMVGA
jgi:ABC-type uncharacterized transport system ATPase subunit